MKLSNKQKFIASIAVVFVATIVGFRIFLGSITEERNACLAKEGWTWDFDTNSCVPDGLLECEREGGTWDWTNHECIEDTDEPITCPYGYYLDEYNMCVPERVETTETTVTTTPDVMEFGSLLPHLIAALALALVALIRGVRYRNEVKQ